MKFNDPNRLPPKCNGFKVLYYLAEDDKYRELETLFEGKSPHRIWNPQRLSKNDLPKQWNGMIPLKTVF